MLDGKRLTKPPCFGIVLPLLEFNMIIFDSRLSDVLAEEMAMNSARLHEVETEQDRVGTTSCLRWWRLETLMKDLGC